MRIGELAERAGVSTKTIRYYEGIGLIPEPPREPSGYRRYGESDLSRLRFILDARRLDLSLEEISDLLAASEPHEVSCPHVVALLERRRDRVAEWLRQAQAIHDALDRTVRASRRRLASASPEDRCPVVERGLHERASALGEVLALQAQPLANPVRR